MDTSEQALRQQIPQPQLESEPNSSTAATAEFEAEVASASERIRELRAGGLTAKQIHEALPGVSAWAVNCAINRDAKAHAAHPGLRVRAKDADRERARALRLEGKTYKEIRAEVNVSSATLSMSAFPTENSCCLELPCTGRKGRKTSRIHAEKRSSSSTAMREWSSSS